MSVVLTLTMPARDLRRVVKTVAPAAERYDDSRPALNAVSITRDPANGVEFTATDRCRLHTVQIADHVERAWVQDGSADTCAGLVPAWWLRRWARERTTESGSATLTIHDDRASIAWGAESRTTTLVTGDFPDWKKHLADVLADAEGEVSVTSPTAIGYNPRFLSALMKAAARWGACAGTPHPLRVQRIDAAKPFQGTVVNPELGRLLLLLVWRVFDAQWCGVAQRRRRVFVVAGPGAVCGPEVLVEPESVPGGPRPSRTPGQEVAGTLGGGSGSRGWAADTDLMTFVPAFTTRCGSTLDDQQTGQLVVDLAQVGDGPEGGLPVTFDWQASAGRDTSFRGKGRQWIIDRPDGPTRTIDASKTLAVAYPLAVRGRTDGAEMEMGEPDIYNALRAGDGGSSRQNAILTPELVVRRLTPVECERLMGWPDDWSKWAADGRVIADSHRYRMCGNGVVAPLAEWIGRRMVTVAGVS